MTKVKKDSAGERVYDADGYWLRAACVCVRDNSDEILLVSSSAFADRWIIPGGKIEADEQPDVSAAREAKEEAGVVGRLGRFLGVFDNTERRHRTRVFVLHVQEMLEVYEDVGVRKRAWFPFDEAMAALLSYKPMHCKYLTAFRQTQDVAEGGVQNGGGGGGSCALKSGKILCGDSGADNVVVVPPLNVLASQR